MYLEGWHGIGIWFSVIVIILNICMRIHFKKIEKTRAHTGKKIYLTEDPKKYIKASWIFVGFIIAPALLIEILQYDLMTLAVLWVVVQLIITMGWGVWKLQMYAIVKNHEYHGYSMFDKEFCAVDSRKKVYYAIFGACIAKSYWRRFIVLSNERFEIRKKRVYLNEYRHLFNTKKQVIMPYDRETIFLLDFANGNWECVYAEPSYSGDTFWIG